jgi:hypothetical protein
MFKGRGMVLSGKNINLDSGQNSLWIDGPGQMSLPISQDMDGKPLAEPQPLEVQWQKGMRFDGRTATFADKIVAQTRAQRVETQTLEVAFQDMIRFHEAGQQAQPRPERVVCRGGTVLTSSTHDAQGRVSQERIEVADTVTLNLVGGDVAASGPGAMTTVRRGAAVALTLPANEPAPEKPATDPDGLTYLHVRFRGGIVGNLHRRTLTFRNQVRTLYGPVDDWDDTLDPNTVDGPGVGCASMDCDELTVTQMTGSGDAAYAELVASRNVVVEGQGTKGENYVGRAGRITYDQAKDLLILEGDTRSYASLSYQQYPNGPQVPLEAQKIRFYPRTTRVGAIEGLRTLNVDGIPIQRGTR